MSIEKRFNQPSVLDSQEVIKRERRKEEKIDVSKRKFLKTAGVAGFGVALGYTGILRLIKELGEEEEVKESEEPVRVHKIEHEKEAEKERELVVTKEQQEILKEDRKSIEEIIDFDSPESIKFNLDTVKALKNHWEKKYRSDLKPSLDYAYREIGAWEPELRRIFREERVPEKFIYLAIPESHWKTDANSGYAVGPYQFTERTGRKFKLRQGENVDERRDPMKSGRACAKYLRTLYKKTEDWNLSLSLYNGGFAWKHLSNVYKNNKDKKKERQEISYKNYSAYIEEKLNKIKKYTKESPVLTYKVVKGDKLKNIARYYGVSLGGLAQLNGIKDVNIIKEGQVISLPISDGVRRKDFLRLVNGYKQNLNYPAKFNAVMKLINEGFVTEQKKPLKYKTITISRGREIKYAIKPKDTLYSISKKFDIAVDVLKINNPSIKVDSLPVGYNLKVPERKPITLLDIARRERIFLGRLKELNPAIKEPKRPIPDGFEIRV